VARSFPVILATLALNTRALGQSPPVIDSIVIETFDIFTPAEAARNPLGRIANALHIRTRPWVVRNELLFHAGDTLNVWRLQETERNLRRLGLFSQVVVDTAHDGDRLVARVSTSDGWTTNGDVGFSSTGGSLTWHAGVTERNLLGTGNTAGIVFRHEPDRSAVRPLARINRPFGTPAVIAGYYDDLSDGRAGEWAPEVPFLSLSQPIGGGIPGAAAARRVLRFRDGAQSDSLWRRTFIQRAWLAWAPVAGPGGYVHLGVSGHVRREEYLAIADTAQVIPDTVSAIVGPFIEAFRPRFIEVTHYNGFARDEDIDLGPRMLLSVAAAPAAWGYARDGVGAGLTAQVGGGTPAVFGRLLVGMSGLFTSAGLDSGQVRAGLTLASRLLPRQATVLNVQAGVQKDPAPGAEFDLGHGTGPRGFGPHSFTGTRTVWGTAEHRVFLWDALLDLLGIGVAAFVDFGGAWYEDQAARLGGDAGIGLRLGLGPKSTGTNVVRFDIAYRFGEGWSGDRGVLSVGRAFEF
jgi:hypothetical protein